ncbi:DUF6612 family protein [Alkalibacterium pelagium]|uniref:Lipoprotein n=1 Tax=Alkalibacterium pelagium TaxID=426702 RepID=A0A1H7MCY0_9LACT|nr:DUF6612 family protein [Alkalibacterium pelagium]GEN51110.1 hypothetical protein APE02nite_17750 [Alkalibacterium pelagium]SEL08585.1 hypothetical protein SAMN04488099_11141 [Alkalibacterium pelagium]
MTIKRKIVWTVLGGTLLTGCGMMGGGIPNDLDDNWVSYMQEAESNLDSYSTDINLSAETDAMGQSTVNRARLDARIIGDFDSGHVIITNEQDGVEVSNEIYFDGSTYYIHDGSGWQEVDGQASDTEETSYRTVLEAIINSEEYITAEVEEDNLILSYTGYDQDVWDAFEVPFSLTIDGFEEEDIELILEVIVDAETQLIEQLDLLVEAENELASVILTVDTQYADFNEIDQLEVEDDILEETTN